MSGSVLGQVGQLLGSRGLLISANLVTFVLLARVMDGADFGTYGVFTSAIFLVEAGGHLGLRQAMAHQIGQGQTDVPEALGSVLLVWPIMGLVCGLLVWMAMDSGLAEGGRWVWLGPALLACAAVVLSSMCQGFFLGTGRVGYFGLVETLPRVLVLLGVLVLALLGQVDALAQSWLFAVCFGVAGMVAFRLANGVKDAGRPRYSIDATWNLIRRGWPFALLLFVLILNTRISMFILAGKLDVTAAGQYFAALRLNDLILQVAASTGLVLFSHAARSSDPQLALVRAVSVTRWGIWIAVIVAAVGLAAMPILVPLVLGGDFAATVPILALLLLALPFAAFCKIVSPTLAGLDRPLLGVLAVVPAIAVNAFICMLLVEPLGAVAGGIALMASQIVMAIGLGAVLVTRYGIRPRDMLLPGADAGPRLAAALAKVSRKVTRRT
jgi:O-antigen/teichoic acid export membrane protein